MFSRTLFSLSLLFSSLSQAQMHMGGEWLGNQMLEQQYFENLSSPPPNPEEEAKKKLYWEDRARAFGIASDLTFMVPPEQLKEFEKGPFKITIKAHRGKRFDLQDPLFFRGLLNSNPSPNDPVTLRLSLSSIGMAHVWGYTHFDIQLVAERRIFPDKVLLKRTVLIADLGQLIDSNNIVSTAALALTCQGAVSR